MRVEFEELQKLIKDEFEKLDKGGKLLLSVSCKHVLQTNILLLQFLLNQKDQNGVYICVDIPQVHVERLLKKYHVRSENLKYIDAITGLSTLEREVSEKIIFIENPFDVRAIIDAILKVQTDGVKRFIILDNMATLQFYSSEITNFFDIFINSIDRFNMSYLIYAVDKFRHKDTYDRISKYGDSELEIKKEWLDLLKKV